MPCHWKGQVDIGIWPARLQGWLAAIRVITGPEAQQMMLQEVEAFQALYPLQGRGVPQLLGAGPLQGGTYFTATKYIKVMGMDFLTMADDLE